MRVWHCFVLECICILYLCLYTNAAVTSGLASRRILGCQIVFGELHVHCEKQLIISNKKQDSLPGIFASALCMIQGRLGGDPIGAQKLHSKHTLSNL